MSNSNRPKQFLHSHFWLFVCLFFFWLCSVRVVLFVGERLNLWLWFNSLFACAFLCLFACGVAGASHTSTCNFVRGAFLSGVFGGCVRVCVC